MAEGKWISLLPKGTALLIMECSSVDTFALLCSTAQHALVTLDYEDEMQKYFEAFPKVLERFTTEHQVYGKIPQHFPQILPLLFDAWVTMLFRACCWGACHSFVLGERVSFEYYGSQLPV